jgi:hypothetical protein
MLGIDIRESQTDISYMLYILIHKVLKITIQKFLHNYIEDNGRNNITMGNDKENKETRQYVKDNEYKKDITIFINNDINKKMLDKEDIDILHNDNINKYKK